VNLKVEVSTPLTHIGNGARHGVAYAEEIDVA
jgi:hypothetical protein